MKTKRIISGILSASLFMLPTSTFAAEFLGLKAASRTGTALAGATLKTPEEYIFTYGGQKFIMLDKEEKEGETYFYIASEDTYGKHMFDSSNRPDKEGLSYWEPDDEYNMAYWLNNDFLENGNDKKKIPDKIKEYIDTEREWHTEPMNNLEGYNTERVTIHPLALMANYEWKKYYTKIGQPTSGINWYLRTGRGDITENCMILNVQTGNNIGTTSAVYANRLHGVRPVFYLSSDFFANAKLETIGKEVMFQIDEFVNPELYSQEEIEAMFTAPKAITPEISGEIVVGKTLTVNYTYEGLFDEGETVFAWYRADSADGEYSLIENENKKELLLLEDYQGQYIKAQVTPKSKSFVNPEGTAVMTETPVGFIFGAAQTSAAIEAVIKASADEVFSKLDEGNIVFGLDLELAEFDEEDKANIAEIFSKMEFDTIDELRSEYKKAIALQEINNITDATLADEAIRNEALKLDLTRYAEIEDKSSIFDAMTGKEFDNYPEFEKEFYKEVAFTDIKNADRTDIKEILLYHNQLFASDLSTLNDYQLGVAATLVLSGEYASFETLDKVVSEAFETAENAKVTSKPQSPSGGSSGASSSKGSGGRGSVVTYHNTTIPNFIGEEIEGNQEIKDETKEEINFNDLDSVEWARESIYALAEKGIVSGDGDGSFRPNDVLTRGEFVRMVVSAFYPEQTSDGETDFEDVKSSAWYAPFVKIGVENKIISGISKTEFGAEKSITREDIVVILYRGIKEKQEVSLAMFEDSDEISSYALEAVIYMAGAGIINGMGESEFAPKQYATRAMAAQVSL